MNTSEAQRRYLHTNLANIDRMTKEELIQLLETIPGVVPVFLESQEEYEEITTKDPKTFYIIEKESGTDISHTIYLGEELIYSSGVPSEQEIFIAEYGVTPVADIATAYHAGKVVYCKLLKANYPAGYEDSAPADAYVLVPLVACWMPTSPVLWFSTGASNTGKVLLITHTGGWSVQLSTLPYYTKPADGIPESDLSQTVKNGLVPFVNANMSYEEVGIAYNNYGRHLLYEDYVNFGHGGQYIFLLLTNYSIDIVEELEVCTYCFSGICRDLKDADLREYFVTKKLDINGWETLNVSPVDAIKPQRFYVETGKYLAIDCAPGGGKILDVTISVDDNTQSNFKILIGDNDASVYCQNTPEVDFYYGNKADWNNTHLLLIGPRAHVDIISLGIDQTSIELIDTSEVDNVSAFDGLHIAYEKPSTGIPASALAQSVQSSLNAVANKQDKAFEFITTSNTFADVATIINRGNNPILKISAGGLTGYRLYFLATYYPNDYASFVAIDEEDDHIEVYTIGQNSPWGGNTYNLVQIQANWAQNNASAVDYIKNKPTKVSAFTNDAGYLTQHQNISGKADKVSGATNNNFASLDANGNLKDSGHKHSDYLTSHQDISGKADKVSGATNNNFAKLDANGNLGDSGKKASDFQPTLISGTTIKTINNQSLLGSGNINIGSGINTFIAEYNVTDYGSVYDAYDSGQQLACKLTDLGSYDIDDAADVSPELIIPFVGYSANNDFFQFQLVTAAYKNVGSQNVSEVLIRIRLIMDGNWHRDIKEIMTIN